MRGRPSELTVEDWSVLQPRLLWCYEGAVAPEHHHQCSTDRHLFAWWVRTGAACLTTSGRPLAARAGDWLCGGPLPRRQDFSADARIFSVNFKLEWPSGDSLIPEPFTVSARKAPQLGRAARPLLRFIRREFPRVRSDLRTSPCGLRSFFQLQKLFSTWLAAYLDAVLQAGVVPSRMKGLDPRVLAALRLLDRHPWEVPYRDRETANRVGLSVGHLDRLFVQDLGATPRAYLQRRRLEAARSRLTESEIPVKTIAYDLGFSSPAHFCRWFRQTTEMSPGEFRHQRQTRS